MYKVDEDNAKAADAAANGAEEKKEEEKKQEGPSSKEVLDKAKEEQKGSLLNIPKNLKGDALIASLDLGIDMDLGLDDDDI